MMKSLIRVLVCSRLRPHQSLQIFRPLRRSKLRHAHARVDLTLFRYMLTGIDKFDLRDDEWMMVEDELLQTAKLFTQHLHLAEYETLKAKMEVQRKIETPRPVVAGAKLSFEKQMKTKAKEQTFQQKKVMKEVLLAQDESSDDEPPPSSPLPVPPPPRAFPGKLVSSVKAGIPPSRAKSWNSVKSLPASKVISSSKKDGSDSDDLDAPSKPATSKPKFFSKTYDLPHPPPRDQSEEKRPEGFEPPTTPAHTRNKPSRGQRRNLWDDWDELTFDSKISPPKSAAHSKTPQRTRSPAKSARPVSTPRAASPKQSTHTSTPTRTVSGFSTSIKRSKTGTLDDEVDLPPAKTTMVAGPQDRSNKRSVDKKREDKDEPKYDDIPTFLF